MVCCVLALGTALLYCPAVTFDFINYDDPDYILNNFHINRDLHWRALGWCFQAGYASNWHPLTWMSHLLDCQLFGLRPAGHHATSVLLHSLNSTLLFLVLRRMTGAFWRSALVAAAFAWHPLHVESVAWVAERKDVLSTLFLILTFWAYVRYAEEFKIGSDNLRKSLNYKTFYALALVFFAFGLMAKPMLVTLPFVLLLLDWWPLGRFQMEPKPKKVATQGPPQSLEVGTPRRGVRSAQRADPANSIAPTIDRPHQIWVFPYEKAPFFLLSGVSCLLTIYAQHRGGSIQPLDTESIQSRLSNALVAYCQYLAKIVWPANLCVIYPLNKNLPAWEPVAAGLFLIAISAAAVRFWKTRPYFLAGWLWFLGTLVPVIGLVQVGDQAIADRYTYIPSIGVFIGLFWAISGYFDIPGRCRPVILSALACAALASCIMLTARQLQFWQNSEVLFRHALDVTPDKTIAHATLGAYYLGRHQLDKGRAECEESIRCGPAYPAAHLFLGQAMLLQGKPNDAAVELRMAVRLAPRSSHARFIYGQVLVAQNLPAEAAAQFEEMLRSDPGNPDGHFWLGKSLAMNGQLDEAVFHFNEALRQIFQYPEAHFELAMVLSQQHKIAEAVSHYRTALRFSPNDPRALNNLAWILVADPHPEIRNGAEAVRLAERACVVTHHSEPFFLGTLADAYAEAGRFDEAVKTAQQAHDLAVEHGLDKVAARNLELLEIYRSHHAYHEK
jgi:tetratricopeptide (TPR) repeat protein